MSAGDVGRYAYCALNWKRSLEGHEGRGGKEGVAKHREVAERVDALELYQARERLTQDSALFLALFAASAASLGVELFALQHESGWWWFLVFLSVIWMAASLYFLVFNLYYARQARSIVRKTCIQPGQVVFGDSPKHAEVLESRVVALRGRPDYVVDREGALVPVELKTGRTPRRPYDSHVLQLAAYCYLVNERYRKRPPFGVLSYPDHQFEVPYTPELEDRLLKTLLRIDLAERTGVVHRDHENPKRCRFCSRREGCPERLG